MNYFKLLTTHSLQKNIQICLLLFIVSCCLGCTPRCEDIKILYETYYQAGVYPEQFDNYVQNNKAKFNNDFFSCLDEKRDDVAKNIEEEYELCDRAHTQGSEFWHQCYDDVDQQWGGIYGVLAAITEVTRNNKSFVQTDYGLYLILVKQEMGANDYESMMKQLAPTIEEFLTCEKCKKKFFLSS